MAFPHAGWLVWDGGVSSGVPCPTTHPLFQPSSENARRKIRLPVGVPRPTTRPLNPSQPPNEANVSPRAPTSCRGR